MTTPKLTGVDVVIFCDTCGNRFEGAPGIALREGWTRNTPCYEADPAKRTPWDFCPRCEGSFMAMFQKNNEWAAAQKARAAGEPKQEQR